MAVVLHFVAITGDARLLAADKVKTWKGQATMETGIGPSLVDGHENNGGEELPVWERRTGRQPFTDGALLMVRVTP